MSERDSVQLLGLDEMEGLPVGGKAEGLARLRKMGLRVPDALVLIGAQPGHYPEDLDERLAPFGDVALAVRSSAIGEDGEDASFAGQYETILDVRGPVALREAIDACLQSAENDRATAYRTERDQTVAGDGPADASAVMSVVIQKMVDARASGVCFTADPVTHRRSRLVIDSVAGLGEALVSGHASPDHDELIRPTGRWEAREWNAETPVLSERERAKLAAEALEAERIAGEPLDLEWAVDAAGELFWLQARPITTLAFDPRGLDTTVRDPRDVFTRCNVGEMMPGAVSPLTFSTCARGIDVGWQKNMMALGIRDEVDSENVYIGMSHGHLFINLSEGARFTAAVTGSSPDQQSLAICGRLVPEVVAPELEPLWVRLPRVVKQVTSILRPQSRIRRMETLLAAGEITPGPGSLATWRAIDERMDGLFESYALHLTVSSGAGALAPILLRLLSGDDEPTDAHHAVVAHLFSGAKNVESADIAEGATRLLETVLREKTRPDGFEDFDVEAAIAWLNSDASGEAGRDYRAYLSRHGHRSLRELDVRQPEWAHDPTPVIRSLQAGLRGRLREAASGKTSADSKIVSAPPAEAARFQRLVPVAHAAVRNRERGKSLLVGLTAVFKRAYRALGAQLVKEGRLADVDAVYFLTQEELGTLAAGASEGADVARLSALALSRREALAYQETLAFPEVAVGLPEPEAPPQLEVEGGVIIGKPVSRGRVEGPVRVVLTLEEAQALQPGEILVAPITDVGWTPYFAIIAGLVTDVGSAVSHGAVVAREYGLPAVLNTRSATQQLSTGDRVRLDGDRGRIELLDEAASPATTSPAPPSAGAAEQSRRFEAAIEAIDRENAGDPNRLDFDGRSHPKEVLHAQRATHWVGALVPAPSESLLLAARGHHLRRWMWPRSEFPEGRAGYHAWRRSLGVQHADGTATILKAVGYDAAVADRVGAIIRKEGLGRDPEVQVFEDALCLVFLETQLSEFASKHADEKVIGIILKTLRKMSDAGRAAAGSIEFGASEGALLKRAVEQFKEQG